MTASSYGARVSEQSGVGRIVVTMVTQSSDERGMTAIGGTYNPVSVHGRDEGSESIYIWRRRYVQFGGPASSDGLEKERERINSRGR